MGRTMNALLGRSLKPAKFKPLVNLAVKRFTVLKTQRGVRFNQARSDVVQLLNLGHHERALLRVEQVIKEQNMLDVLTMMEGYCLHMVDRILLIRQEKECPEELKEAISSLIYAASRCGDLPEVQEIRAVLTSRYGKEFAARAIELRNNCGVNHTLIQKLSTRMPSLESRMSTLEEIALEKNIVLQFEKAAEIPKAELQTEQEHDHHGPNPTANTTGTGLNMLPEMMEKADDFSGSVKSKKYRDVAHAAQAAFESAAYAAAAARAAVELSRSGPHDPDDESSPHSRQRKLGDISESAGEKYNSSDEKKSGTSSAQEVHRSESYDIESDNEEIHEAIQTEEAKQSKEPSNSKDSSSLGSGTPDLLIEFKQQKIAFDKSDDEKANKQSSSSMKPRLLIDEVRKIEEHNTSTNDTLDENENELHYLSRKQNYTRYRDRLNMPMRYGNATGDSAEGSKLQTARDLNIEKKPFSMRTRGVHVR